MTRRLNWGTGMALAYGSFATATLAFVFFALGRPVDLVAPDYYARSLRQDEQMRAERNARDLGGGASIAEAGDRAVVVSLPAAQAASARGAITLYRPSSPNDDRVLDLRPDVNGRQTVSLNDVPRGLWSVRVRWTAEGREFYLERRLVTR